ncbi:phage virion morphogenesis protein [Polymorphobacter sp.]|uniref:phage virion morphogenesis protein n=1 Tax=Polymorphobacter sp. TaxID=1909290 RepID=UPI003F722308
MLDFVLSDTLSPAVERARKASIDFTPVMATIADYMRFGVLERFEAQAGPDGEAWTRSQRALAEGGLTLTKSGELKLSITADSDATSAIAGTNKIYAAIHQFGGQISRPLGKKTFGPRAPVTIPARPFLGFSVEDLTEIEKMLGDHIKAAFEGRS